MEEECINCGEAASGTYTLVIPAGALLDDEPLCESCQTLFRGSHKFEIHEAPLLLGGDDRSE